VKEEKKRKKGEFMLKSIKMRSETYDKVKLLAKSDRRNILTMLDIIVEQYEEDLCEKEKKKK
jgi:hypothetical protein